MKRSRKLIAVAALLVLSSCGVRFPDETPPQPPSVEEFFVLCMANFGYRVFSVEVGDSVENCCGFSTEAEHTPAFDRAMTGCEEAVYKRFGSR